jgi:hypothetical protein
MNHKLIQVLSRIVTTASLSDRDEEIFGQGGCWELALVLAEHGLKLAVVEEKKDYAGEIDISYPHAFAIDGGFAVDVYGRVPLSKFENKWKNLLSGEVGVVTDQKAREVFKNLDVNQSLHKQAETLVDENKTFFLGKKAV